MRIEPVAVIMSTPAYCGTCCWNCWVDVLGRADGLL